MAIGEACARNAEMDGRHGRTMASSWDLRLALGSGSAGGRRVAREVGSHGMEIDRGDSTLSLSAHARTRVWVIAMPCPGRVCSRMHVKDSVAPPPARSPGPNTDLHTCILLLLSEPGRCRQHDDSYTIQTRLGRPSHSQQAPGDPEIHVISLNLC
jgi:hypothetical protein